MTSGPQQSGKLHGYCGRAGYYTAGPQVSQAGRDNRSGINAGVQIKTRVLGPDKNPQYAGGDFVNRQPFPFYAVSGRKYPQGPSLSVKRRKTIGSVPVVIKLRIWGKTQKLMQYEKAHKRDSGGFYDFWH
jgi:hypothetical protein